MFGRKRFIESIITPRLPPVRGYIVSLFCLIGLTSCSRPSTEAYVRALEKMAELSDNHQDNCQSMGRALSNYLERHGDVIRDYQDYIRRMPDAERKELENERFGPRVRRAMKRMIPGHKRCMKDDDVRKAYEKI